MRPTHDLECLPLEGVATADDSHSRRIAIEVVMGSLSCFPSTVSQDSPPRCLVRRRRRAICSSSQTACSIGCHCAPPSETLAGSG